MPRLVDADKLRDRMYEAAFQRDSDMPTLVTDDLISRSELYYKAAKLEAQALDHVGKLIERDGDEPSVDWRIWTAILNERTAFKHDVSDAIAAHLSPSEA